MKLIRLEEKNAPNFGGVEYWWEATYKNDEGKTSFGAGKTPEEAKNRAKQSMNYIPKPFVTDPNIPF